MQVSVIIVSYQVKYFLECCLRSVEKALKGLDAEIIVVDNDSRDDSLAWLQPRFPAVRFLANRENAGFAKANNRALESARGEYILFLNPDTLLPEDFAAACLGFLAETPGIGALGVKMIDGSGQFLKESRRGFPTPWVAFCRLSGLSALFPRSRAFSMYYLGHLSPEKAHPAPILSGACFWVSRTILDRVGSFDERFFLYAEDIDLSYRIGEAGYINYYTPAVTIIHFKGESTRKDTRYVRQFYRAMRQFRRKHFNRGLPAVLNWAFEGAIGLRAFSAAIVRVFRHSSGNNSGSRSDTRSRNYTGSGNSNALLPRTFIAGDPAETDRVKRLLAASGKRELAGNEEEASEILYCEGVNFGFREIIRRLGIHGKDPGRQRVLICGKDCGAAIGSPDRNDQGTALVL